MDFKPTNDTILETVLVDQLLTLRACPAHPTKQSIIARFACGMIRVPGPIWPAGLRLITSDICHSLRILSAHPIVVVLFL